MTPVKACDMTTMQVRVTLLRFNAGLAQDNRVTQPQQRQDLP